ncbi:virulence RhuM family protein [Halomonas tibetensis]|uniref:Virulence RhuM family protein n=1 Tax=Halomonas tibetensis TaxID=2259590 RepID=A0ABV7B356_9GAMM
MSDNNQAPIVIYQEAGREVEVRLDAKHDTVWLTQEQLTLVLDVQKAAISKHLSNIYKSGELDREATVSKMETVRLEGGREVRRSLEHYNLDAIISVGYRVNSRRAVQFRQWATRVLREHLTQGWTLNRQRFEENARELEAAMALVRKTAGSPALDTASGRGLVDIVTRYAQTFLLLQRYDEGLLTEPRAQAGGRLPTLEEARTALASLKAELIGRGEATPNCSPGNAVTASTRYWAISIRRSSASRPTPRWRPRPHTCSTS